MWPIGSATRYRPRRAERGRSVLEYDIFAVEHEASAERKRMMAVMGVAAELQVGQAESGSEAEQTRDETVHRRRQGLVDRCVVVRDEDPVDLLTTASPRAPATSSTP